MHNVNLVQIIYCSCEIDKETKSPNIWRILTTYVIDTIKVWIFTHNRQNILTKWCIIQCFNTFAVKKRSHTKDTPTKALIEIDIVSVSHRQKRRKSAFLLLRLHKLRLFFSCIKMYHRHIFIDGSLYEQLQSFFVQDRCI